jgi:outer membrane protein TolC
MTHELTLQSRAVVSAAVLGFGLLLPAPAARAQAMAQAADAGKPVEISLDEAIRRAQANEPAYAAAVADARSAGLDRLNARAQLLPNVIFFNQYLYTQPVTVRNASTVNDYLGTTTRFIANNAVHEYVSQGQVNENLSLAGGAAVRLADAQAAQAAAAREVARRGLVSTVSGLYYGVSAAEGHLAVAQEAQKEATDFNELTKKRESARESAHADVVKAQLVEQQRDRELADARVMLEKARLELGVLLFPDPRTPFTVEKTGIIPALATRDEVNAAAGQHNPDLREALAQMAAANAQVLSARAAYVPSLALNYTYGIDAPQFAEFGPNNAKNTGYSASVTVEMPVWDWLSTERKVQQSHIRQQAAQVALTAAQKRLVANLDEMYSEAQTARDQLQSLDDSVKTAAESLRLTEMRYTAGEATVLEVVDAETAYMGAENAREDGWVRYQAARADLQSLTGTL